MIDRAYQTDKALPIIAAEEVARLRRSPLVSGLRGAARGALVAAPLGGALQALRVRDPLFGAALAGVAGGIANGFAAASLQKYENVREEAQMRDMLRNVVAREPMVAAPEPEAVEQAVHDRAFAQGFRSVYRPY